MKKLKKFLVSVPVTDVSGYQTFLVEAEDEDAAAVKWLREGGEFVEQSLEVISLSNETTDFVVERE